MEEIYNEKKTGKDKNYNVDFLNRLIHTVGGHFPMLVPGFYCDSRSGGNHSIVLDPRGLPPVKHYTIKSAASIAM